MAKQPRNQYRRGMILVNKSTGKKLRLMHRATGNRHWLAVTESGVSHKVHEGTLDKFYQKESPDA